MLKSQIEIGKTYVAKISGKLTNVKIMAESRYGNGWDARNTKTHREVRIKSAANLRSEVKPARCISGWVGRIGEINPDACDNCVKVLAARESFTRQYREAIATGTHEFAAKIRQEYKDFAAATPCLNPRKES